MTSPNSKESSPLAKQSVMAFVATLDGARARTFYETTLGLTVVSDDDFAIALDANGTQLRVQKVAALAPHPFTALGWAVMNIDATVETLTRRGVTFKTFPGLAQDERGVWSAPSGARVAWFQDPDGNVLSLTEL
jgi:catechol 2,3-dioxygenase-like lactoylglutathione lyase family enzyme